MDMVRDGGKVCDVTAGGISTDYTNLEKYAKTSNNQLCKERQHLLIGVGVHVAPDDSC
jgi:hypothetical protein